MEASSLRVVLGTNLGFHGNEMVNAFTENLKQEFGIYFIFMHIHSLSLE